MPKSCGLVGGLQHFSVSPRPLGFWFGTKGFGAKGLGPGLDSMLAICLPDPPSMTADRKTCVCHGSHMFESSFVK